MENLRELTMKGQLNWLCTRDFLKYVTGYNAISYLELMSLNDDDFLKYILNPRNAKELNQVVDEFPAYDIALNCYNSGHLTVKQRAALTNIYLFYQYRSVGRQFFQDVF